MTIKQLLGLDVLELEAMSDEQLVNYLRPFIIPVNPAPKERKGLIVDVTELVEKHEAKKSKGKMDINDFIAQAKRQLELSNLVLKQ